MNMLEIQTQVNGRSIHRLIPARLTLVDFLRDELRLTGAHIGCEQGVCGACTILFDDEPIRACLMLAAQAHQHRLDTVEGLADEQGNLSTLQQAFCDEHAMQCGYCTPGMLMTAQALLRENPDPTDDDVREAISGNLCRCTGYAQIVSAIQLGAARHRQQANDTSDGARHDG